jgi:hypothetical protein
MFRADPQTPSQITGKRLRKMPDTTNANHARCLCKPGA